jgi:CheY-like chemotaxis protein
VNAPPRCLVVEDDADAAQIASDFLRMSGYESDVAGDGERALELYAANRYQLIFLDIQLPGMDGVEVARRMCGDQDQPPVPIIVASAIYDWSSPQSRALRDLGAIAFLAKPFSGRDLEQALALLEFV